jgi:hypothetical protein
VIIIGKGINMLTYDMILEQEILKLRAIIKEVNHICTYGWTDVKAECNKIYNLTKDI